jgi:hypothetical protein
MCRRSERLERAGRSASRAPFFAATVLALLVVPCQVLARQTATSQPEEPAPPPKSVIEQYLSDRGLNELLAAHLLQKLKATDGPERLSLADRLGSIFVGLLDSSKTAAERAHWEGQGQDLLRLVPEAESFNLRLNLAKARYLLAEDVAEKHRLRLISPEERAEAETSLRNVNLTFADIGAKLNKRIDQLEKRESGGAEEDGPTLRSELAEARRLRSLAFYYAGWSGYYSAFLTARPQLAEDALQSFGWLLNASGGRAPSVQRAPATLLRYEHVARSAIGVALCEGIAGRDTVALAWLDAIEAAEGVPDHMIQQLFSRRIVLHAAGKRWADLARLVERKREPTGNPLQPLPVGEARLLAVVALEALEDASQIRSKDVTQVLADIALTDLITQGEVRHVQDLVGKFGSAPLAGDGFIVQYVRGLQAYERARSAHAAAGENVEESSAKDSVVNLYRAAATALDNAAVSKDGSRFAEELSNAALLRGLATYYAGDLAQAADRFEQAFQTASAATTANSGKRAEDSLWMAIVALDKAVEGGAGVLKDRLGRLGSLFLQRYPKSDRAAKLLLRQASTGLVTEEKAVEILMGVGQESPLYETARRQAASLLYTIYRRARGADRDFAALRFAELCEEIVRIDRRKLAQGSDTEAKETVTHIVARVRQMLDAVLGMSAPDLERADKALEALDAVVASSGYDLSKLEDEVTYRRFQIAVFRGKADDITSLLDKLHGIRGPFSDRADRMMYNRAIAAAKGPDAPVEAIKEVVRHGLRVIDQFGRTAEALKDPAVYSLHNSVADAAARAYRLGGDKSMRDIAVAIDKPLLDKGDPPIQVLRRYAELGESAGDKQGALECWRIILAGAGSTNPAWFEARYQSLRLLLALDPQRAADAMAQHKVLHPEFGPEPWGAQIRELDARMGSPVVNPEKPQSKEGPS